jgi:hypothetical protein
VANDGQYLYTLAKIAVAAFRHRFDSDGHLLKFYDGCIFA